MQKLAITLAVAVTMFIGSVPAKARIQTDANLGDTTSLPLKTWERDLIEMDALNSETLLSAQGPAVWCYTDYGAYRMVVAVPVGASCHVNVPFWPFVLNGVAGY
jgi:hypothetical protein